MINLGLDRAGKTQFLLKISTILTKKRNKNKVHHANSDKLRHLKTEDKANKNNEEMTEEDIKF